MRIRYAESALADLDAIHDYQAAHWPSARAAFEARLTAIETRLLQFPQGAPNLLPVLRCPRNGKVHRPGGGASGAPLPDSLNWGISSMTS